MSTARLAGIPIDHVVAEVAAFPLTGEKALELAVTDLHPRLEGTTQELWRAAERYLLGTFPAFSVEEAVAIRDRIWFHSHLQTGIPLAAYLRQLAGLFLEVRGETAVPALPGDAAADGSPSRAAQARRVWRWMSFALPPDLLLAALNADRPGDDGPAVIDVLSPPLALLLRDRGYAETHCHIGAALEFPLLWIGILRALADTKLPLQRFESPGAGLDEGRALPPWLVRAAIARHVLAEYLAWGTPAGHLDGFFEGAYRRAFPAQATDFALLRTVLLDLGQGGLTGDPLSTRAAQGLYAELTRVNARRPPRRLARAQATDPIAGFFPPLGPRRPTPEMRFVAAGLRHLGSGADDPTFATLFWQVVRVRTLFYRHVVQRPMTPGLQWFIRFYGRISPSQRPVEGLMLESAASVGGAGQGLSSLEVRTSPEPDQSALLAYVHQIDRAARRCLPLECEYGLVLHFTKDRGGGALQGRPAPHGRGSHADPAAPAAEGPQGSLSGYRFARFYAIKRKEALAFAWVLRSFPLVLRVLRGLDVCTDELGVPTWTLVPLIDYVRRAGELASAAVRRAHGLELPPLRTTVHVGEDFVHLLSGLRRVDEALTYLTLREGDRIGHGLALGVEPREWARRGGLIPLTREERLFDLVWEWNWYAREGGTPPGGRQLMIERDIFRLAGEVFGPDRPAEAPHTLDQLLADLHDVRALDEVGFPDGKTLREGESGRPSRPLLWRYLTDGDVFASGRRVEWIDPGAEGEALAAIQTGLRRKVAERGVTVEVNPTSNLLVGDLQDLTRHPLWRLRPPRESSELPPVSVCLGSDDPLTFATNLRQEFQLVQDALLLAGFTEEEARRWLERTRASGLETRFTLPRRGRRGVLSWHNADYTGLLLPP
jgi:hypothetical protein